MTELNWQNYNEVKEQLSDVEKDWLFDTGSLTKRLTDLSQDKFSLDILADGQNILREDECCFLNIHSSQSQRVREVVLKGNNVSWVYARSIILSDNTISNYSETLMKLGEQPLGSILFNKGDFIRSSIEVAKYPQNILPLLYADPNLWVRRSCFYNNLHKALVQEVFLVDFWGYLDLV